MRVSQPEVLVIRRQGRGHGGVRTADPLQRQRDLGVIPVEVVTTVAADDLEGVPEATFPRALREQNRLTPDARRNAVPGLTSDRDSQNTTGLSAAPRIAGMPPAIRPDVLRTASGPGTGLGMRRRGAHLDPTSVVSATAGVWSSAYVTCQYGCGIRAEASAGRLPPRPSAGLRPSVFSSAQCLASAGQDAVVRVWDPATGGISAVMRVDGRLKDCAWSPSGQSLAAAGDVGLYHFTFKP
jgi:hypothetical protein